MAEPRIGVTVRIPAGLHDRIKTLAESRGQWQLNAVINEALETFVKRQEGNEATGQRGKCSTCKHFSRNNRCKKTIKGRCGEIGTIINAEATECKYWR
jgi:hypothetical protein